MPRRDWPDICLGLGGRKADPARRTAVIVLAENMAVLPDIPDGSVDLIYTDPPFNTGTTRERTTLRTVSDAAGDRTGFGGRRYRTVRLGSSSYADHFDDFTAFIEPRLVEARRILAPHGSLFVHLDAREVHYVKVLLDGIFGRDAFVNEIIWAYDYGGRPKRRWPAKHDTILWYAKDPSRYTFNYDEIDRVPYMAPGLVTPEKAARGKTPTDVWWHTIVSPTGGEKTGYPTQKPLGIVERIVKVHSSPGDLVLDMFAGSGTLGEAAARNGRGFILIDESPEAARVMAERLGFAEPDCVGFEPAAAPASRAGSGRAR
jgi:site-specific DNA-methyltransferase (adenine-specific)